MSCGLQDRSEGCGSRAFAVGSGDEHGGKTALRVAERVAENAHVRKIKLARGTVLEFVAEREEAFNR
jgi:hypothetical protein